MGKFSDGYAGAPPKKGVPMKKGKPTQKMKSKPGKKCKTCGQMIGG